MIKKKANATQIFKQGHWTLSSMKIESTLTGKSKFSMFAERPDTVMIIPFISDTEIIFIREYCPTYDKYMLFLPKGKIEHSEPPKLAAQREIQEEIGFKANNLKPIGFLENDKIRTDTYLFMARNLEESFLIGDELERSELVICKFSDFYQKILDQELTESRTIATLFIAQEFLKHEKS
jgi:ADP-ribose diphosphatase